MSIGNRTGASQGAAGADGSGSTMSELTAALDTALELASWANRRILARPTRIETKKHAADHVTETDHDVERHVRDVLAERFGAHAVVGEEFGGERDVNGSTWYLDPVDGTTNYAAGLAWSSFSLGLVDTDGPAVAVVSDPYRNEVFSAVRGGPAMCNDRPIRCREATELSGEIVTTEWAAYRPWDGMGRMLEELASQTCSVRIMGSTALSLVNVAAGRVAGSVIGTYHAIDAMAATFIAERAGAVALSEDGDRTGFPDAGGICVAAPGVVDALYAAWRAGV